MTAVTIRIGPDRLEALLPTGGGICGPYDPVPGPVWVEVNGVPVDVPDTNAEVQQTLERPASFFDGFAQLHVAVLATLGPSAADIETLAKGRCTGPCLGCATGILRVAGMAGATTLACSSAVTSAGTTLGGCYLAMLFAHATVVEAGMRCAACNNCRHSGNGSHDPCECPCRGEPLCDCGPNCPTGDDDDMP